jgi:lipopolysaccharide export system protein LptC
MNMRPAIIFPLLLLLMLAGLTFWINKTVQPQTPKIDGSSRHDPDYIMSNFVTTQTDINGKLRYKLAAAEMRHFPDNDSTDLIRPRFTQFAIDKPYTQLEGLRGHVSANGEQVELFDNVKVKRPAYADKGEMTVDTDYLQIFPDQELVRTESPVIIRQAPKTIIYATGMIYDKKQQTVTLLHKVRAHYEKPLAKTVASKTSSVKSTTTRLDTTPAAKTSTPKSKVKKPAGSKAAAKLNPADSPKPNNNDARIRRRYE